MVRVRPSTIELLHTLSALSKPYFTTADLKRVVGLSGKSLSVTLGRLVTSGLLRRLCRNVYVLTTQPLDIERIGMVLRYPAYLSFESALSRHGMLSQIPYSLTFATTRPSAQHVVADHTIAYSHLPAKLFWGFTTIQGLQVAEPEKALLDQLYLVAKGLRTLSISELDLRSIDVERLRSYATNYPTYVDKHVQKLMPLIGTSAITNQQPERVTWSHQ